MSEDELDALVAPVALYPDLVLAQVLQASQDPSALVAAGDLLGQEGAGQGPSPSWPGAVKVLLHIPSVVQQLDESLPWTTRLGNAVKTEPERVQAAVQRVRRKASQAGNLSSDEKRKVVEDGDMLKIELPDPALLYVPQYDPEQLFVKHEPGGDPWLHYGPPVTIPGYKDVAVGLQSLEYTHSAPQYHNHYYGPRRVTEVETVRVQHVGPWLGYRYHDHGHHHHHHH